MNPAEAVVDSTSVKVSRASYTVHGAGTLVAAALTREKVGRGRLLGGGASACSRSSTKPRVTSRSRSSSASVTADVAGRGAALCSGFLRCALGGSSADLGVLGFLLLPSSIFLGADTVIPVAVVCLTLVTAAGRGGRVDGWYGNVACLALVAGGRGGRPGWLNGRGGREPHE